MDRVSTDDEISQQHHLQIVALAIIVLSQVKKLQGSHSLDKPTQLQACPADKHKAILDKLAMVPQEATDLDSRTEMVCV